MVVNSTVLYPNESDATFDMDYYLKTHMPLVMKNWEKHGLKKWEVTKFSEGLGDSSPNFSVQCVLTWDSLDQAKKATTSEEAKEVFGDVPNFSNKGPQFMMGDVVGTS